MMESMNKAKNIYITDDNKNFTPCQKHRGQHLTDHQNNDLKCQIQSDEKINDNKGRCGRCLIPFLPVPNLSCRDEVPPVFREPYVQTGFRHPGDPWYMYAFSIFQLHNDTINIWSHILAVALLIWKLSIIAESVDLLGDAYTWPLLAQAICMCLTYSCSVFAHTMHAVKESAHYTWFMVDYAGVGLHALGSSIGHLAYSSTQEFYAYTNTIYIPTAIIIGILDCASNSYALCQYGQESPITKRLLQLGTIAVSYFILISPVFHHLVMCVMYNENCYSGFYFHIGQIIFFPIAGVFFGSFFPECKYPGCMDFFFNSHHWFHTFLAFTSFSQLHACYLDFTSRPELSALRPPPSFKETFGPILLVVLGQVICIMMFTTKIKQRLKKTT